MSKLRQRKPALKINKSLLKKFHPLDLIADYYIDQLIDEVQVADYQKGHSTIQLHDCHLPTPLSYSWADQQQEGKRRWWPNMRTPT